MKVTSISVSSTAVPIVQANDKRKSVLITVIDTSTAGCYIMWRSLDLSAGNYLTLNQGDSIELSIPEDTPQLEIYGRGVGGNTSSLQIVEAFKKQSKGRRNI